MDIFVESLLYSMSKVGYRGEGEGPAIWTLLCTRGGGGVPGRQGRWTSLFPRREFCRMIERLWPSFIPRTGSGVLYLSYVLFVRAESDNVTRFGISLIVIVVPLLTVASSRILSLLHNLLRSASASTKSFLRYSAQVAFWKMPS